MTLLCRHIFNKAYSFYWQTANTSPLNAHLAYTSIVDLDWVYVGVKLFYVDGHLVSVFEKHNVMASQKKNKKMNQKVSKTELHLPC